MALTNIRLDHKGIGEMLNRFEVRACVLQVGWAVGRSVTTRIGSKYPVVVDTRMTQGMRQDREAVNVVIKHPAGKQLQAKYGALTRAAADQGLEVRARTAVDE